MTKDKTLAALAPHIDGDWRDDFVLELRLQGASGTTIADALVEVENHCTESRQSATDAFGPAVEYAKALNLPDESRFTPAQLLWTYVELLLYLGGISFAVWGGFALLQGQRAEIAAGSLVSAGVIIILTVLLFTIGNGLLRFILDHLVWAGVGYTAALALTVLSGLPFRDINLGSLPALVPFLVGVAALVAGAAATIVLRKTGNSLDDLLVGPDVPAGPNHSNSDAEPSPQT